MVIVGTILAAESSGGISAIGLNLGSLVFQLINFAILFWVLKKVAYKPILKVLEDRRKRIEDSLKLAAEIEQNQRTMAEQQAATLKAARAEAAEIVAKTRTEAAEMLKAADAKAMQQTEKLIAEAHNRIEQDLASAKTGLKREVAGLVVAATEAVLSEKVDAKKDEALIERALKAGGVR